MSLDALLGNVFNSGVEVELGGGLNFASGLQAVYNPATNQIDVTATGGGGGGGHVIEDEGTPVTQRANLNFVGVNVTVTDAGGKTVVTIGQIATAGIADDAVTYAKIQNVTAARLLGSIAGGDVAEIPLDASLEFSGGSLRRVAITGDVTISAGSNAAAIAAGVIVDADVNAAANLARTKLAGEEVHGSDLTNANTTIDVSQGNYRTLPAGTLASSAKTLTFDETTGTPVAGEQIEVDVYSQGQNYIFHNGGPLDNDLITITAGQKRKVVTEFDGVNWLLAGVRRLP